MLKKALSMLMVLVILLPLYVATPSVLTASASAFVVNPSFEDDGGWADTPIGWSTSGSNPAADFAEAGNAHSGSHLLKHWSPNAYQVYTYQVKTNLPNGIYTLKAWVINGGGQSSCYMNAKDYGGSELKVNLPVTYAWTQIELKNIRVTNGQCTIGFYSNAGANQYCAVDDVEFYCTNLVVNPSFEDDGIWVDTPVGWSTSGATPAADFAEANNAHSGSYILSHWNANAYQVYTYQTKTNIPNGTYTLKAWVKRGGGQTECYMNAKDYGGPEMRINLPVSGNWTQITISDIKVTNGQCTFGFYSNAGAGQYCSIDDIEFYCTDYVQNGSFEQDGGWVDTPSGWYTSGPNPGADFAEAASAHSGSYILSHWNASAYRVYTYQTKENIPNGKYTLSAWVKRGSGQTACYMNVVDYGGPELKVNLPVTGAWTQIFISDIEVTNSQCTFGFYSDAGAGQYCSIDDVQLIKNEDQSAESYSWSDVTIQGGGYVTGLVAHPGEANLLYARTDVGGVYRWDNANAKWIPLLDGFGSDKSNYYSVESFNVDPSNTNVVYVAVGRFSTSGDVLRSTDRGNTWTSTGLSSSVRMSGNGHYRWAGERLAVDPNNSNIVYYGSRRDGLWKITNPTSPGNWTQISTSQVPVGTGVVTPAIDGTDRIGITFVVFDKNGGVDASGRTNIIYAGVFGSGSTDGVYRSTNAGSTWSLVSGSPKNPIRAVVADNGTVYVTHKTGVSKCTRGGTFTTINNGLASGEYSGISVSPSDPNLLVVARQDLYDHNQIYRSTNGGSSWSLITTKKGTYPGWWPYHFWFAQTSSIVMDPFNTNKVWYSDWYGIWRTENITQSGGATFNAYSAGHEEACVAALCSPSGGNVNLFSGLYDLTGFRHTSFTAVPSAAMLDEGYHDTTSIAVFEGDSNIIYRVTQNHGTYKGAGYKSVNNGQTWTKFNLSDTYAGGKIAVSPTSSNTIVWVPYNQRPRYSTDGGNTWNLCGGITSTGVVTSMWDELRYQLAANKTGSNTFYIYRPNVGFWRSTNGGASFSQITGNGLPTSSVTTFGIKTVPEQDGGVWVYLNNQGLYKSDNSGTTFTKLNNVSVAQVIAFGKKKPGSPYPATVFLYGKLTGDSQPENRLYISDDMGQTWRRINDENHKFGLACVLEGDRQVYGRVYVGTSGRGVYYGEAN